MEQHALPVAALSALSATALTAAVTTTAVTAPNRGFGLHLHLCGHGMLQHQLDQYSVALLVEEPKRKHSLRRYGRVL